MNNGKKRFMDGRLVKSKKISNVTNDLEEFKVVVSPRSRYRVLVKRVFKEESSAILEAIVDAFASLLLMFISMILLKKGSVSSILDHFSERISDKPLTMRGLVALFIQVALSYAFAKWILPHI